jgi:hypothetical protein
LCVGVPVGRGTARPLRFEEQTHLRGRTVPRLKRVTRGSRNARAWARPWAGSRGRQGLSMNPNEQAIPYSDAETRFFPACFA